jgi:hypothetical protein
VPSESDWRDSYHETTDEHVRQLKREREFGVSAYVDLSNGKRRRVLQLTDREIRDVARRRAATDLDGAIQMLREK